LAGTPKASSSTSVVLITPEDPEGARDRYWAPIKRCWPGFHVPADSFVLTWEGAIASTLPEAGAALIIASRDVSDASLFRLLDRLSQAHLPAVVVGEEHAARFEDASEETVIAVPSDTDPIVVASMLCALLERQPKVRQLESDVRVARRFQGGLRGEIDRIHEELQLAASVQREFLPLDIPTIENVDVRVLFRPCGYVSGDIYDVQRIDEHRLGFFVADAVGHGVPAALMTMVLCRCLTTKLAEGGAERALDPCEVLRTMNTELIRRHGDTPRFATAVYGIIDGRTLEVRMAGAGHPHPLRIRGQQARPVHTDGGLLGIFPEDTFEEVSFTLEPDELLVLFSDGFETAFPSPTADAYGRRVPNRDYVRRFTSAGQAWADEGMDAAVEYIAQQIDAGSGSLHQVDDLTALLVGATNDVSSPTRPVLGTHLTGP